MDNKTVFVRTSKGEDEMHSRTTHLPGDIKRALLMVDGNATIEEIRKRAAPSLRSSLDEMLEELEKDGFIKDKDQGKIKAQDKARDKARHDNIPKMSVPVKIATPQKSKPVDEDAGELDFMSGFTASEAAVAAAEVAAAEAAAEAAAAEAAEAARAEAARAEAARAERLKAEAENKSRQEIEAAKLSAQREAEAILHKAEQEAARIREETVRRAKAEAEATRIKAEQEAKLRLEAAAKLRQEAEAEHVKAEQEAKLRLEAAAKLQQQAEAERLKAEQEAKLRLEAAAKLRQQAEAERIKVEQEADQMRIELEVAKVRAELEAKARLEASAKAHARIQAEEEAAKIREEAERRIMQEQEAAREAVAREQAAREIAAREQAAREIAAKEQAARTAEATPVEKPSAFAFDSFQVDKPLYTSESHKVKQPAQKAGQPEQNAKPAETPPAKKPGGFAFDSFQVDQPLYTSESHHKEKQPEQKAGQPEQKARPPEQKARSAQQPAAPERTAQAAEGRRPERQQQAPPPAANKPADGKPSQEQIQRAMQERKAVEERMAAEALAAKKMAEEQARVWAEAEQRALQAAKAEVEQSTRQVMFTTDETPVAKPAPVARVSRKPFSWGKVVGFFFKLGLFLLVLLVGALFIIPYVVPMRDYMPKAEQMLSAKLHQPVHIGKLSGRILPMPRLEVGEIYIGDSKQFQADEAKINFSLTGIFTEEKPVNSIEFQGVKVRGAWVRNVAEWLQKMANEKKYPVSRIVISQGKLDADVFELTGIEGELQFDQDGKFARTNLRADTGKYAVGINVNPEERLQVAITVHNGALPLLPNWTFDELTAKGEINNNGLAISDFDGRILGGQLQGNASIDWHSGWRAQGAFTAKTISMQQLSKLLEGNVEGSARFKMTSLDLGGLPDSVTLDGTFNSKDGMIGGMEIVETARTRSRENLPGGRTHYDELSGVVSYANGVYHFKQTKISASALTATAAFDVDAAKQQLSGKMNVNLSLHEATAPVDLQMGGAFDSPTLRFVP